MKIFSRLFSKQKNNQVNKKRLLLVDYLQLKKNSKLRIKFISANANRTQFFLIKVEKPENKKYLELNGKKINGLPFHMKTIPESGLELSVLEDITLKVWNRGTFIFNWPMQLEIVDSRRVYYCNADNPSNKFDDLIFQIEVLRS